jgi:hypothetical protein
MRLASLFHSGLSRAGDTAWVGSHGLTMATDIFFRIDAPAYERELVQEYVIHGDGAHRVPGEFSQSIEVAVIHVTHAAGTNTVIAGAALNVFETEPDIPAELPGPGNLILPADIRELRLTSRRSVQISCSETSGRFWPAGHSSRPCPRCVPIDCSRRSKR